MVPIRGSQRQRYDIEALNTFFTRYEFRLGLCLASDIHGSAIFRTETLLEGVYATAFFWQKNQSVKAIKARTTTPTRME